ncbi:uracil-DNA glycosylase [Peniophora sp. CONT]|nr:uracil-DNA glycosylase [Peniophora sp. CONT]
MSPTENTVYYEDLHPKKPAQRSENASSTPTASQEKAGASGATTAGVKRQRTINDMFGAPKKTTSGEKEPATKKLRMAGSGGGSNTAKNTNTVQALGSTPLNSIPFNPSAYVAALSADQKRLLALEVATMGKSWLKVLKDEIKKPYFLQLKEFLWSEGVHGPEEDYTRLKIYPSPKNIYSWSNFTPLGKVKVVIIGQDPYHGAGQAHGAFVFFCSRLQHCIYAEIKAEYPSFVPPKHGNLISWANAGVLLINTALTVRAGQAGSHANRGWETFTSRVVAAVDAYGGAALGDAKKTGKGRGVVFLCWGKWAAERVAKLDAKKHLILKSAHPSPMSANRGFLGNGHFKSANKWLAERYGPEGEVDWCSVANPNPPSAAPSTSAPAQASSPPREPSPELAVTPPPDATGDEAEMDALANAEPVTVRAEVVAATADATTTAEDELVGSVSEADE